MINRLTYTVIDCYWGPKESITITSNNKSFQLLIYNPQIEMFARFKMKSSFHKTKRII